MPDILDTSKSIYDILAEKRAMLEQQAPQVAAQLPAIGAATPGQRMYQTDQQQPATDLANTVQSVLGQATQAVAGPQAKPKDQAAVGGELQTVFDYLNPLKPKETYGPNIGKAMGMGDNAGGVLGLGIQPIDILAFTIGAALTSRMPQDKAIATTMHIAGMPKAFRDSQEQNARAFIDDKMKQIGLQLSEQNLVERQMENAQKAALVQRRDAIMSMVSKRLATGQPLNETEQKVIGVLGHGVIDPGVLTNLMSPSIKQSFAAYQQLKQLAGDVPMKATIDGPGKSQFTLGGSAGSGRPLTAGEIGDYLSTGKLTDRLQEAGITDKATAQAAYTRRKEFEQQRVDLSKENTDLRRSALEMIRPEESKKLTALQDLHIAAGDMLGKYEASLKSHGGKFDPALNVAIQAATTSPDGFIGKSLQALGQRYPGLTQQDLDFISRYASMQKFARGSLNDVGNLSNYERGIFQTMVGTPLDKPEVFRSRTQTAMSDAARAYDQEYRSLGTTRNLNQFPNKLGAAQDQPQSAPKATHRYNPATGKVEVIK